MLRQWFDATGAPVCAGRCYFGVRARASLRGQKRVGAAENRVEVLLSQIGHLGGRVETEPIMYTIVNLG